MHHPHHLHQRSARSAPELDLVRIFHTRSQLYGWLDRANNQIIQLRDELSQAKKRYAELHEEVDYWRKGAARRAGLDLGDMPPEVYVEALRAEQREPHREIVVDIDDIPWTISLARHPAADPDPLRELRHWQLNVAIAREERSSLAVEA